MPVLKVRSFTKDGYVISSNVDWNHGSPIFGFITKCDWYDCSLPISFPAFLRTISLYATLLSGAYPVTRVTFWNLSVASSDGSNYIFPRNLKFPAFRRLERSAVLEYSPLLFCEENPIPSVGFNAVFSRFAFIHNRPWCASYKNNPSGDIWDSLVD